MILYHGSNVAVEKPNLVHSRKALDFGAGFYLTSDMEQAKIWAKRVTRLRKSGTALISVYETNMEWEALRKKRFEAADLDWLRFVIENRTGASKDMPYDVVIGPVANDRTIDVLNIYLQGTITEDIALRLLLPQKLKDQWVVKTEVGLNAICFKEGLEV